MPEDSRPPWFKFYPDVFASDGLVEAMSTEEVGAYMLLLCKAWRENPPGSIPSDDYTLARWTRLSPDRWTECKLRVLAPFKLGSDDRYHQKRLRAIYQELVEIQRVRSEAGRAGANALHGKRMANARDGHGIRDVDIDLDSEKKEDPLALPVGLVSESMSSAWAEWLEHKRQIRKKVTPLAARKCFKKFLDWGEQRSISAIEHCIASGYSGIFEPSSNGHAAPRENLQEKTKRMLTERISREQDASH